MSSLSVRATPFVTNTSDSMRSKLNPDENTSRKSSVIRLGNACKLSKLIMCPAPGLIFENRPSLTSMLNSPSNVSRSMENGLPSQLTEPLSLPTPPTIFSLPSKLKRYRPTSWILNSTSYSTFDFSPGSHWPLMVKVPISVMVESSFISQRP